MAAAVLPPTAMSLSTRNTNFASCPQCGQEVRLPDSANEAEEAQRRIRDLEAQVKLLNQKAAAAVDKLADYEDEVRFLRAANSRSQQKGPPRTQTPPLSDSPSQPQTQSSRLSSLSSFLALRRRDPSNTQNPVTPISSTFAPSSFSLFPNPSTPHLAPPPNLDDSPPPVPRPHRPQSLTLESLQTSLETERTLRVRAEASLTQTQTELEELTAQLFGQANEMVAQERRERAKLEQRVQVLEQREKEKRKRLDRLEKAIERIERIRNLVAEGQDGKVKQNGTAPVLQPRTG